MGNRPRSSIAAGAAIIFAGTLASRVIGLVRENLLNNTFSDRLVKDAFASAFLVPDTLYYLLAGGALSAAFIPVLTGYLQQDRREEVNRVTGALATLLMLAMTAGLLLIFIFAPGVVCPVPGGLLGHALRLHLLLQLALSGLAGALAYAGVLWALRSEELFSLVRRFGDRFWRGRAEW